MTFIFQLSIALFAIGFFAWLLIPSSGTGANGLDDTRDTFIDPNDTRQIALVMGMTGGSIVDAAVMRYALQRFQETYGRRATTRDIAIVIGLIQSQS